MKKLIYSTILSCYLLTLPFNPLHGMQNMQDQLSVLTENKQIKQPILDLLALTNITHDGTLNSIVKATQKSQAEGGWLRKAGVERWQMEDLPHFKEHEQTIITCFKKLSMLHDIIPSKRHYKYCFWFGGTADRVR